MISKSFLLAALLSIFSTTAFAQNSLLGGVIFDDAGVPVGGATVTITQSGVSATTDSTGAFRFENVAAGDYDISVSRKDFPAYSEKIHHEGQDQSLRVVVPGVSTDNPNVSAD
ncbi:MAG: carboxypeptidase-like regulatory domain-containing protein, partial [Bacteroidota bacterium]